MSQAAQLARVSSNIEKSIIAFCERRRTFHGDELRQWVAVDTNVAPASPDRVLRLLRKKKVLNYRVLSRSQSLYEMIPVLA